MKLYLLIFVLIPYTIHGQWPEDTESVPSGQFIEEFPCEFSRASQSLLKASGIFTSTQIESILAHRNKYGEFLSRDELQVIDGITPRQMEQIALFFTFRNGLLSSSDIKSSTPEYTGRLLMLATLRKGKGIRYRTRLELQKKQFFMGLRIDQDFGEKWRWNPQRGVWGADHISGSIQWQGKRFLKSLTIGEFRLQAGEGLVHAGRFFLGKGSQPPLPAARTMLTGRPSYNENNVRQGLAVELGKTSWRLLAYGSRTLEDAHVYADGSFRSITSSGLHSSPAEKVKHNRLRHYSEGVIVEKKLAQGSAGFTVNMDHFSHPFAPVRDYQASLPKGRNLGQASVFGTWHLRNGIIWTEHAFAFNGERSSLIGWGKGIGRYLSVFGLLRDYSPGYLSFYGRGFSESSSGQRNEQGLYFGISWKRKRKGKLYSYMDLYRFPASSYRHLNNLWGIDFRIWAERKIGAWEIRTLSKYEGRTQSPGSPRQPLRIFRQQFYAVWQQSNGSIIFRGQLNIRKDKTLSHGQLVSLERRWKWQHFEWSVLSILFHTPGFYTREFIYERDVWGTFSLPSYFGTGARGLVYLKWVIRPITVWLRAGVVCRKQARATMETKVQLKYQF